MASFFVFTRVVFNKCIRPGNVCGLFLTVSLQLCIAPDSLAGPPLAIDDPGILDPGTWEAIIALSGEDRPVGKIIQSPLLDLSLGISKNTQLSFSLPHMVVKPDGAAEKSGLAYASVGYKWRIVSTPTWEWAIASNYTSPVSNKIIRADGPEDIRVLGLPLLVSRTKGDWTWNGQVGWNIGSDGIRFWDYGIAVSHPLGNSIQLMMEVFGYASSTFEQSTLNYQLGLDYEINPDLHLLTSAGSGIKSDLGPGNRLNYSFYVGLQWFH